MKKRLALAIAAALTIGATGTAFAAANPFVDVPAKHWAYDAVTKLAKDGIVDGYNDGTFRGNNNITRYEMAQIVAKAMAKADKANAEDKALINKLATEFSDELNNLGVRVSNLEKNQSNLKFSGTADIRYTATDYSGNYGSVAKGQYRLRMDGTAKVDDKTTFGMRITTQPDRAGGTYKYNGSSFVSFGQWQNQNTEDKDNSIAMDRLYVSRQMGAVKTTVGAQALKLGTTGLMMDAAAYSFDGVRFEGKSGVVNMAANWGRFQDKLDVASFEAGTTYGKLAYGAGYASLKDNGTADKDIGKYIYGNAAYTFDNKLSVGGEYMKNDINDVKDNNAWLAYALYGDQAIKKAGDNNIRLTYMDLGANSVTRWNAYDLIKPASTTDAVADFKNQKEFIAQYTYGFSNNLSGWLVYEKATDDQKQLGDGDMGYTFWRVGLTAKF